MTCVFPNRGELPLTHTFLCFPFLSPPSLTCSQPNYFLPQAKTVLRLHWCPIFHLLYNPASSASLLYLLFYLSETSRRSLPHFRWVSCLCLFWAHLFLTLKTSRNEHFLSLPVPPIPLFRSTPENPAELLFPFDSLLYLLSNSHTSFDCLQIISSALLSLPIKFLLLAYLPMFLIFPPLQNSLTSLLSILFSPLHIIPLPPANHTCLLKSPKIHFSIFLLHCFHFAYTRLSNLLPLNENRTGFYSPPIFVISVSWSSSHILPSPPSCFDLFLSSTVTLSCLTMQRTAAMCCASPPHLNCPVFSLKSFYLGKISQALQVLHCMSSIDISWENQIIRFEKIMHIADRNHK